MMIDARADDDRVPCITTLPARHQPLIFDESNNDAMWLRFRTEMMFAYPTRPTAAAFLNLIT